MRQMLFVPIMLFATYGHADAAPPAAARGFALSGFDRVVLRGPDDVTVRVGPGFAVRAAGPQAELDRLDISVVGGELRVGRLRGGWGGRSYDDGGVTVTVTLPTLRGVSVAGSGNMRVDRATAPRFQAAVAGSGDLEIGALRARAAKLDVAGSGDLAVAGMATQLDISVAGSGDIDAARLASSALTVSVAGSGDVRAATSGRAAISIVGSGDVEVRGTRNCTVSTRGSGEARCE